MQHQNTQHTHIHTHAHTYIYTCIFRNNHTFRKIKENKQTVKQPSKDQYLQQHTVYKIYHEYITPLPNFININLSQLLLISINSKSFIIRSKRFSEIACAFFGGFIVLT